MTKKTIAQLEQEWGATEQELRRELAHRAELLKLSEESRATARQAQGTLHDELAKVRAERDALKPETLEAARLRGKLEVYEALYPHVQRDMYDRMRGDSFPQETDRIDPRRFR